MRWAATFWLVALLVAACTAHSVISTGPDGFRTFAVVRNPDGSSVACAAFGLTNPVAGILDGQAGAREPVWLRADDGRHVSVVWPAGFTPRFAPDAAIHTDRDTLVGRAGDRIVLGQTGQADAAGTFDDPYFASDLFLGSSLGRRLCYEGDCLVGRRRRCRTTALASRLMTMLVSTGDHFDGRPVAWPPCP